MRWSVAGVLVAVVAVASACASSGSTPAGQSTGQPTVTASSPASNDATAGSPSSPERPSSTVADTRCHTADLSLSRVGGQGAAGTGYTYLALTNISSRTCSLFGYPGVSFRDASGAQVWQPAQRTGAAANTVTVSPGVAGYFVVSGNDVTGPECPQPVSGSSMVVYPPDETQPLILEAAGGGFLACRATVGPVQAGQPQ